jgi:hypothetical protein
MSNHFLYRESPLPFAQNKELDLNLEGNLALGQFSNSRELLVTSTTLSSELSTVQNHTGLAENMRFQSYRRRDNIHVRGSCA